MSAAEQTAVGWTLAGVALVALVGGYVSAGRGTPMAPVVWWCAAIVLAAVGLAVMV